MTASGVLKRVLRRAHPWPDHEWTSVDGRLLHAAAAGPVRAPTIVLVHGHGVSHRYLAPLVNRLSGSTRVVALDLPGFGLSPCPDPDLGLRALSSTLVAWLRATEREGSVVVGHSTGCQVVVDAAVHAPEVFGRLVLAGPTVDDRARTWPQQASRLLADLGLQRPDLLPVVLRDYAHCGTWRYVRTFDHMLADRIEDKVTLLEGPTVLVRGQWDLVSPRAWNQRLLDRLADGRRTEVPFGGHNIGWTRAGTFARVLEDVLQHAALERAAGTASG